MMNPKAGQRLKTDLDALPLGGLCLLIDIFHRVAITARASHLGHKPRIVFTLEFGHTNAHINDGFIDGSVSV